MNSCFSIAQITPYPLDQPHEVNDYVFALSQELNARGHSVTIFGPASSVSLVSESSEQIQAAIDNPNLLLEPSQAGPHRLHVGELLVAPQRQRIFPPPPVNVARTIGPLLQNIPFDFVHVHEPFAVSVSSIALRHSRSLNVGSFHSSVARSFNTKVVRRFVELFFGRLDIRTASSKTTAQLTQAAFGGDYELTLPPLVELPELRRSGPLEIGFWAYEEPAALRLAARALSKLPQGLEWQASIYTPSENTPTLPAGLSNRVSVKALVHEHVADQLAGSDIVVLASNGNQPTQQLVMQAAISGVQVVAPDLDIYTEFLQENQHGILYTAKDYRALVDALSSALQEGRSNGRVPNVGLEHKSSSALADQFETLYARVAGKRQQPPNKRYVPNRLAERPLIDVDLHMHTDHSYDCATPVETLLSKARKRGLGAIAVTDHNEITGAFEAQEKAAQFGVKIIVAEEIMTAEQGEVIGLFIKEKIPKGLTLQETIAEIRKQGGLVYIPHPFDRMHSVPDYKHLLDIVDEIDAIEVFNPRVAVKSFNEEAVRFATKYRIIPAAGSDAHVTQGLGSVHIRMRDFDGPGEFLESLADADIVRKPRSLFYVQALKFLQTKAISASMQNTARKRKIKRAVRG